MIRRPGQPPKSDVPGGARGAIGSEQFDRRIRRFSVNEKSNISRILNSPGWQLCVFPFELIFVIANNVGNIQLQNLRNF